VIDVGRQQNLALIERYFDLVMRGVGDPSDVFADDVTWHLPRSNPMGGPFVGRDAVLEMLAAGVALYDPTAMASEVHTVVADDTHVAIRLTFRTRTTAGRDYEGEYQFIFECRNGRIFNVWESPDTLYQHQIGVFATVGPPPG
jgi:ketosteroid isomerase-like protein